MRANRRRINGKRVRKSYTAAFKSASAFKHVDKTKPADHPHEATATPPQSDFKVNENWQNDLNDFNKESKTSNVQKVQSALTGVELLPDATLVTAAASSAAGVINGTISLTRSASDYMKGDKEKGWSNLVDAGLSATGAIPLLGYGATVAKASKTASKYGQSRHLDDVAGKSSALNVPKFKDSFFGGALSYLTK
tara:strand:- start:388 stop:969 length:582 start_codon:yes stop_codon:yes gene_type:complete